MRVVSVLGKISFFNSLQTAEASMNFKCFVDTFHQISRKLSEKKLIDEFRSILTSTLWATELAVKGVRKAIPSRGEGDSGHPCQQAKEILLKGPPAV